MSSFPITLKPFGETAILMEWPNQVDEDILMAILSFQEYVKRQLNEDWVMVPAYNSLTLINAKGDFDYAELKQQLQQWYQAPKTEIQLQRRLWKLPVCYDLEFGWDLEETAQKLSLTVDQLIQLHTQNQYTVYGIGFLPGFMYLGGIPKSLETKRKQSPRLQVERGSVGLAGKQTGIYPQDSPGGWNILGRCPVPMFNTNLEEPCFVGVGDKIQFVAIERAEYDLKKIEAEVGIYKPENELLHV